MNHLYIMQGVPGSSKSTLAGLIAQGIYANGNTYTIRSTDSYFMKDGIYCFDRSKIGEYHRKNQDAVVNDMIAGINAIFVDNTNITNRDCKVYIDYAKTYSYSVTVIRVDPGLEESIRRNNGRSPDKRIPEDVIRNMYAKMEVIKL